MALKRSHGLIAVLSACTAGIVFGLGFVAAASKFKATKPDLLSLLDVGRIQFISLHLIEAVLIPVVIILCIFQRGALRWLGLLLSAFFAIQMFGVLPGLDGRMAARLHGQTPGPSWHHDAYTFLASGTVLSLLAIALVAVFERAPVLGVDREPTQPKVQERVTTT